MESSGRLLFHKRAEILIAVQKILVLIAVAGQDVFDQRFCPVQFDGIFISEQLHVREVPVQQLPPVSQTEAVVQFLGRKHDTAVKTPDQTADLLHVAGTVGAAEKEPVFSQDTADLGKDGRQILTVEKHMIGDHPVKGPVRAGDLFTAEYLKRKPRVLLAQAASGVSEHAFRDIREQNVYLRRKPGNIFLPQGSVPAAQLQDL